MSGIGEAPSNDEIVSRLVVRLDELWDEGSTIANGSDADRRAMAMFAVPRWRGFDRRNKVKRPELEHRVEDLAKGLRDRFAMNPRLVGPEMTDYRYVAARLADILKEYSP